MYKKALLFILLIPFWASSQSLSTYRYWFDNDFASATIHAASNNTIELSINTNFLQIGFHKLNFQVQDSNGFWSSITTSDFVYAIDKSGAQLSKYRYWFDNDFLNAQTKSSTDSAINLALDASNLSIGYHKLNFQAQDSFNQWSLITTSDFIYTKSNPEVQIVNYRYWFDNDFPNSKSVNIASKGLNEIISNIDVEGITEGTHTINVQFQDNVGNWSSITTDTILRNPITSKLFIEPKVYVSKSVLQVGQTQTITGSDFTANGEIKLYIQNSLGEFINTSNSINYFSGGKFSYTFNVDNLMPDGEYIVYAVDINTGSTSPSIKFKVANPSSRKLSIKNPINNSIQEVNKLIQFDWTDFVSSSSAIGKTAYVYKRYKIIYSLDNGTSWIVKENQQTSLFNKINQNNNFSFTTSFSILGNYILKIIDLDNPVNFNTTKFSIVLPQNNEFSTSLEWDNSFIIKPSSRPRGLAADGTARLLVKLVKNPENQKLVSEIFAQIVPVTDNSADVSLLGKIKYATNINYNEAPIINIDASDLKPFSIPSNEKEFYFYLQAPDDFVNSLSDPNNLNYLNNQASEKYIKVVFKITFSDQTSILKEENVTIVRPPVIMVHGLNGSSNSFAKAKYNVGTDDKLFQYSGDYAGLDGLFKTLSIVDVKPYGSFIENAEILLGIQNYQGKNGQSNNFQSVLKDINDQGFAAKRLDYICHSMGGSIARTIINRFPNEYKNLNYGRGYINKLITINTPHNGSPIADLLNYYSNTIRGVEISALVSAFPLGHNLSGFFEREKVLGPINIYRPSGAVIDLQSFLGGVTFGQTDVKINMLGSALGEPSSFQVSDLIDLYGVEDYNNILKVLKILLPKKLFSKKTIFDKLNDFMEQKYSVPNILSISDGIVLVTSQFPGIVNINTIPVINENIKPYENFIKDKTSISYGIMKNHISVTDNVYTGTRIMQLLNAPINSGFFGSSIEKNHNLLGREIYGGSNSSSKGVIKQTTFGIGGSNSGDSTHNYIDTLHIKIVNPLSLSNVFVDSTITVQLNIIDTFNLQKVELIFQGEYYESDSKVSNQFFNIKVHSNTIGFNTLVANGVYDSLGYTINHSDTVTLKVLSIDTLNGFYVTPKSQNLNRNQIISPVYNVIYNSFVGLLRDNIDSLKFNIADTNVVKFDNSLKQFISKDTGSTYIAFNYKGFKDTAFIYLSSPNSNADLSSLITSVGTLTPNFVSYKTEYVDTVFSATSKIKITANIADPTANMQIRVNGGGYVSIVTGIASADLPLNIGDNPIDVKVIAQDGVTIKIYNLIVTRIDSGGIVGGGANGGLESKSLGDNLVKRIYTKAINNENGPIDYAHLPIVTSNANRNHTTGLGSISAVTLSDIMPDITSSGFVAYNSTPSDIITFTNAKEVNAIDFTSNNECKAVAFATKTQGFLYDHTKPICDRLKGASLISVENMNIGGFDLVNYTLNNEKGQREYATSFSIGSKNGRADFSIQSTWLTKDYIGDETMYNFQLWAATPELVKSMVMDIFAKLNSVAQIKAISKVNIPSMFVLSGKRERTNLNLVLANTTTSNSGYFILEDKNNEASTIINTRTIPFTLSANGKTNITIPMNDIYESTISMYMNGVLKDVVYMSDGTWYADYNKATTVVNSFTVSNDPNRNISADEFPLLRNVSLKANSPDYISIVKLMKGGGMEADLSLYKGLKFTASGGQSMHITLVKNSVVNWNEQYYADINLDQDQKDYFIGLDKFKSDVSSNKLLANDISSIAMSVIVSSGRQSAINTDLSNVSFTKEDLSYINSIDSKDIQVFPNPANTGKFNCTFYSNKDIELTMQVNDVTGRLVGSKQILATKGFNKVSLELSNTTNGTHIVSLVGSGVKYNSKKIVLTN